MLGSAEPVARQAAPNHEPKSNVVLLASLEHGIGGEAFKQEMETCGRMDPSAVIEDLKKRAKVGKVREASQKPNRLAIDDAKTDFTVVSPKAPSAVEDLLAKTKIRFFRTIDEALASLDKTLYERDVAVLPHSTVPVTG